MRTPQRTTAADLGRALTLRGYTLEGYENVLGLALTQHALAHETAADVEVREIGGSHTEIVSANYSRILARNIDETLGGD